MYDKERPWGLEPFSEELEFNLSPEDSPAKSPRSTWNVSLSETHHRCSV